MKDLAKDSNCQYIRWADDIIFAGSDQLVLEKLIHKASKELMECGLHLNAYKTKCYSNNAYKIYRCIDVLEKINSNDDKKIDLGIEWFKERLKDSIPQRKDTVFKNLITVLSKTHPEWKACGEHRDWLKDTLTQSWGNIAILDSKKLIKLFDSYSNPVDGIKKITSMTTKKPYTSPKAELIKALKKILKTKETSNEVRECINEQLSIIKESSKDSEIIQNYCIGEII
jgi:hypothetical protein